MFIKLSDELKEARLKSGVSIEQIAAKTRIDIKFLENIENGNFAFLPELYLKAFLKEYSRMVGLDEKIIIKKFDAAKRGKAYDELGNVEDEIKKPKPDKEEPKPEKLQPETPAYSPSYEPYDSQSQGKDAKSDLAKRKNLFIGAGVGLVVILIVIYFAFIKGGSDIIVSEKPYEEVQRDNEQRYAQEPPKPVASDSNSVAKSDSMTVAFDASDVVWIKVLTDGRKSDEFTLYANSHKELKGRYNFKMTIGNAGAVKLKLNNSPLNFTGGQHEVKYISIDSTGLQYITPTPKQ